MLLNKLKSGDAEDPDLTDEDEPPTLVVQGEGGGILKKKLNRLSQERNHHHAAATTDHLYNEIKTSGGMVASSFSRLVDSDSSLNSSSSSGLGLDKGSDEQPESDAEIVKELVNNRQKPQTRLSFKATSS